MLRYFQRPTTLHPSAYVAQGAVLIGDVTLEENSSVWYNCVLRADINAIHIGRASNIQDGTVIHLDDEFPTLVGQYVTVGHKAILHACTIDDEVLIGMGATILDGAHIGARSIIGANALVTKNTKIPPGSLVMGAPAKVARTLDNKDQLSIKYWAEKYVRVARYHKERAEQLGH